MSVDADRTQHGGSGLVAWRERALRGAGFDDRLARQLAHERDVDLHALLELIDRGCSPGLAARIRGPLRPAP